jgi:hypothetical protein
MRHHARRAFALRLLKETLEPLPRFGRTRIVDPRDPMMWRHRRDLPGFFGPLIPVKMAPSRATVHQSGLTEIRVTL